MSAFDTPNGTRPISGGGPISSGQARLATLRAKLPVDVLRPLADRPGKPLARVIVVGAGFGGLASAYFLASLGYEVVVYEAKDRVGGRVHSDYKLIPGRVVEAGAELIGYNHAVWIGLAEVFGLGFSIMTTDDARDQLGLAAPLELSDKLLGKDRARRVYAAVDETLSRLDAMSAKVDPYEPWTAKKAEKWDATSVADWLAGEHRDDPEVRAAIETVLSNDNVTPTTGQSLLGMLAAINAGGGKAYWDDTATMRCESGNVSLAERMAAALLRQQPDSVKTGHPVTGIAASGDLDGGVSVTLADGRSDSGDFLVLATPPTTWADFDFDPGPQYALNIGPAVKFLSATKTRFWLADRLAPTGMSDAMGEFWESTDNQSGPPTQQGGISVFAGAGAAERALEQPDAAAWFTDRLDKLLPGYADQIAQHSFVAWPQVPYIKAGYSCPAPGQVTTAMKNLAEPYERRIVFAGEHVNPGFFRYMEGALQSGLLAMGHVVEATAALGDGSDAEPRFRHADVVRALREAAAAGRSFADGEAPAPAPTKKQRKSKSGKKRA